MSEPNHTDFSSLTEELCALPPTGIVSRGNEKFFERVGQEIPLRLHRYPSGAEVNGWVVPDLWTLNKSEVKKDGRRIYDGKEHILGTAHYSRSFSGSLQLKDLKEHLFFHPELSGAHVWHCSWAYRPWEEGWGFCPPKNWIDQLEDGLYQVEIDASREPGEMLVGDCHIKGERPETIVFNTNSCHPRMANDGFAGTAVMIRLFQWLSQRDNRFSYRLVICPEHIGSVHYLANLAQSEIDCFVGGVFGEAMGTEQPFTLGATFWGDHYLDMIFRHVTALELKHVKTTPFRQNMGNDETVWESPGYEIPFIQTVRVDKVGMPFPEYHSSLDTPALMNHQRLQEFFVIFQKVIEVLETNSKPVRKFDGLIALSNPKYQLYRDRYDPSKRSEVAGDTSWGYLQDCLPRYLDGKKSILEIADRHGVSFFELKEYLEKWSAKELLTLEPFLFNKETKMAVEKVDISNLLQ